MKYFLVILAIFSLCIAGRVQSQSAAAEPQSMEPDKSDDHNFLPLGEMTSAQIIAGSRIFNMRYVDYVPNSDAVQLIHNLQTPVEIKVFWGDWCKESNGQQSFGGQKHYVSQRRFKKIQSSQR